MSRIVVCLDEADADRIITEMMDLGLITEYPEIVEDCDVRRIIPMFVEEEAVDF